MREIKQTARMMTGAVLLAVLLCGTCLTVNAADTTDLDLGRKGEISLTLYSEEAGSAVTDGAITLYEVADLTLDNGNMAYVKTAAFKAFEGTLDPEADGLAGSLEAYTAANQVKGDTKQVDVDGSLCFSGLNLGLYLIVQTTRSAGYYPIESFLVTVPLAQDGVWVYSVDASPKTEVYLQSEPEPEPTPEPTPTPKPVPAQEPTLTPKPDRTLPQTGQLFWPIPVLAGTGLALIVSGVVMRRKKRVE